MVKITRDWYGNIVDIWTKIIQGYSVEEGDQALLILLLENLMMFLGK